MRISIWVVLAALWVWTRPRAGDTTNDEFIKVMGKVLQEK